MTGGVSAALDQVAGDQVDAAELVQAALFDDPEAVGALDAPSPLSAAIEPRRRLPGRPKGARNRRTEAVAAWLLSQARHPVLVMMEAYSMPTVELAERLQLAKVLLSAKDEPPVYGYDNDTLMELFKLQMRMAEAAAPYVAQKLPQAVQIAATAALQVTLAGVSLPARGGPVAGGQVVDGEVLGVRLPTKSDG